MGTNNIDPQKSLIDKVKQWAKDADNHQQGNKDKVFLNSAFEKDYVLQQARNANYSDEDIKKSFQEVGHMDVEEINAIFQLELTNKKAQEAKPDKKSEKRAHQAADTDVLIGIAQQGSNFYTNPNGTLKDTVDFEGIGKALVDGLSNLPAEVPDREQYKKYAAEVAKVADLFKGVKYNNRADVNKLYDEVKAKLKELPKDDMSKFREKVLRDFVLLAERHQKEKETQKLNWAYHELRTKQGKTREEAYEAIKNDPQFKGSYYTLYQGRDYADRFGGGSKGVRTVGHGGLIAEMAEGVILEDARKEVYDAVWAQRGKSHLTTSQQIEDEAEKLIHQDKYTDKIMHKNMRGEMSTKERLTAERSSYKDLRKAVAAFNRVENNKVKLYSRDDFYLKAFEGKKPDYRFNDLTKAIYVLDEKGEPQKDKDGNYIMTEPLIKPKQKLDSEGKPIVDKDGNPVYYTDATRNPLYDISNLSDFIKARISRADMRANYEEHSDPEAEITALKADIEAATGVAISYEDTCHLIDMCGFERDKLNFGYIVGMLERAGLRTLSNMATAAASSFIVGALQGDPLVHVEQAIFHTTDPTAHAVTNIDQICQALLGMSKSLGTVNPDNGVHLNLEFNINVRVNGEEIDVGSGIDTYDIEEQLFTQLKQYRDKGVDYGVVSEGGHSKIWIDIPSDLPYEDVRGMSEILGEHFDLKTDTGVEFKAEAVIDDKGQVVIDKEAEAKVDDKGKAETTNKLESFLLGTAIGFGLNVLQECLAGLPKTDKSIISTKIDKTDFASYTRQLSAEPLMQANPRLKNGILSIAQLFQKDGKWDPKGYEDFLRELAGGRSKLNRRELEFGILEYKKTHEPTLTFDATKQQPVQDNKTYNAGLGEVVVTPAGKKEEPKAQPESVKGMAIPTPDTETVRARQNFTLESKPNYHFGQKHTWTGIAKAFYADCIKQGYTVKQIYTKLKEVNGINKSDNVIPQHLYLPEYLFGEDKGKKGSPTEAQVKAADSDPNYDPTKPVISHGTNIKAIRKPGGWVGTKITKDGIKETTKEYPTKEAAEAAAKKL